MGTCYFSQNLEGVKKCDRGKDCKKSHDPLPKRLLPYLRAPKPRKKKGADAGEEGGANAAGGKPETKPKSKAKSKPKSKAKAKSKPGDTTSGAETPSKPKRWATQYCYDFADHGKCEKLDKGECKFTKEQHITSKEAKKRAEGKEQKPRKFKKKGKGKGKGKAGAAVGSGTESGLNEAYEEAGLASDSETEAE